MSKPWRDRLRLHSGASRMGFLLSCSQSGACSVLRFAGQSRSICIALVPWQWCLPKLSNGCSFETCLRQLGFLMLQNRCHAKMLRHVVYSDLEICQRNVLVLGLGMRKATRVPAVEPRGLRVGPERLRVGCRGLNVDSRSVSVKFMTLGCRIRDGSTGL